MPWSLQCHLMNDGRDSSPAWLPVSAVVQAVLLAQGGRWRINTSSVKQLSSVLGFITEPWSLTVQCFFFCFLAYTLFVLPLAPSLINTSLITNLSHRQPTNGWTVPAGHKPCSPHCTESNLLQTHPHTLQNKLLFLDSIYQFWEKAKKQLKKQWFIWSKHCGNAHVKSYFLILPRVSLR